MGQASSEDVIKANAKQNLKIQKSIIAQQIRLEDQRAYHIAQASIARSEGKESVANDHMKSLVGIDITLKSLRDNLMRVEAMQRDIGKQQVTNMMVSAAAGYVQVGSALKNEISKDEIKSVAEAYKNTQKENEERNKEVEDMFATVDEESSELKLAEVRADIDAQITLQTSRRLPDAKMTMKLPTIQETAEDKLETVNLHNN